MLLPIKIKGCHRASKSLNFFFYSDNLYEVVFGMRYLFNSVR